MSSKILNEITPLSEKDCFHVVDRHKEDFTFPLHCHREYELNFVENARGVRRVVGDSIEEIGDYDLVLICGENLEHVWETGECMSKDIREITIQFSPDLLSADLLSKNQFTAIQKMFRTAEHGVAFPMNAIMSVYSSLDSIAREPEKFRQFLNILWILNKLASSDYRSLASSSFAHAERNPESRRVQKVKQYINDHYSETLRLEDLADLAGMSPASFSRFFKLRTGKTLSDYVIDIRLGFASRELVDSTKNIAEICYGCGFNNLSNFNRIFKAKKGTTPREFRAMYKKNKMMI
ncbi:MAG: AraC family transcriptional regulator [Bacteroidales bacterium]|nr:AraC family transcriptional regulator [Bacteroidales bacterium]